MSWLGVWRSSAPGPDRLTGPFRPSRHTSSLRIPQEMVLRCAVLPPESRLTLAASATSAAPAPTPLSPRPLNAQRSAQKGRQAGSVVLPAQTGSQQGLTAQGHPFQSSKGHPEDDVGATHPMPALHWGAWQLPQTSGPCLASKRMAGSPAHCVGSARQRRASLQELVSQTSQQLTRPAPGRRRPFVSLQPALSEQCPGNLPPLGPERKPTPSTHNGATSWLWGRRIGLTVTAILQANTSKDVPFPRSPHPHPASNSHSPRAGSLRRLAHHTPHPGCGSRALARAGHTSRCLLCHSQPLG